MKNIIVCLVFVLLIGTGAYYVFYKNHLSHTESFEKIQQNSELVNNQSTLLIDDNKSKEVEAGSFFDAKPILFVFAGDVMLDRDIWARMKKFGLKYPFFKINDFFNGDINFVNLEGPITDRGTHAVPFRSLFFKFDPVVTDEIASVGIDLVSLANNHTLNQAEQGYLDTKINLKKFGIEYFGHQFRFNEGLILIKKIQNKKIAFIGWNQVDNAHAFDSVLEKVKKIKSDVDMIFVFPHWGIEYKGQTKEQVVFAHKLIDAGVDIIIGTHPHVVQGIEIYKNKPIFYSLGNFIFDQYWSEETQRGLVLKLKIDNNDLIFDLVPIYLPLGQPGIASGREESLIIERMLSLSDNSLRKSITNKLIKVLDR